MKNKFIQKTSLILLFLIIGTGLYAFDFGGTIRNNSEISGEECSEQYLKLDQTNDLNIWFSMPFNEKKSIVLSGEGLYEYENDFAVAEQTNILDLSLLQLKINFSDDPSFKFDSTLGRFFVTDNSGLIFSQKCDGAELFIRKGSFSIDGYAGYTGLLNAQTVTLLNPSTYTDTADYSQLYCFAAPYSVVKLYTKFSRLFLNQDLKTEFSAFFDSSESTTKYNRYYGSAAINGPISSIFYYSLNSSVGTENFTDIMNLTNLNLSYYPLSFMAIMLSGVYASGNNGPFSSFVGITSQTAAMSQSEPEYSGIIKTGVTAIMNVVNKVGISLGSSAFFTCPESAIDYYGLQWNAGLKFQIFTDLQLSCSALQFYGADATENYTEFTLNAVFAF